MKVFLLTLVTATMLLFQSTPDVGEGTFRLHSKVLDEERTISIYLPKEYEAHKAEQFTALYVIDGEWNFKTVASTVELLTRWGRIPPMIVVAIDNTERTRDLTPTVMPQFAGSGGGASFLEFVQTELVPHVEGNYRTDGNRVIFGHSFGGLFALYAMTTEPDLFDGYISVSGSVWWDNNYLFDRTQKLFTEQPELKKFLYFSAAGRDGGATQPTNENFAGLLTSDAPKTFDWTYQRMARENHYTNVIPSLHSGLQALYPMWDMSDQVYEALTKEGTAAAESWYEAEKSRLGYRFFLPQNEMNVLGYRLLAEEHTEAAVWLGNLVVRTYPESPNAHDTLGKAYEQNEQLVQAKKHYELAYTLGLEHGTPERLLVIFKQHLDSVNEKLK